MIHFLVLAVAILHVYGAPSSHPAQQAIELSTVLAKGSVQVAEENKMFGAKPTSDNFLNLFGIGKLIECYKQYDLDPANLPNIENLSTRKKRSIFRTCSPLLHIANVGVGNTSTEQMNREDIHHQMTHGLRRRSTARTRKTGTKTDTQTTGTPTTTTEVQVIISGLDIITDVIRLQFLFLTTLFGGLSGCIATEGFPQSVCILQSLSNAFAVLTLELEGE